MHERRSIPIHKKHINMNKLLGFVVGMRNPKIGMRNPKNRARLQVSPARGSAINELFGCLFGDCATAKRPGRRIGGGWGKVVPLAKRCRVLLSGW